MALLVRHRVRSVSMGVKAQAKTTAGRKQDLVVLSTLTGGHSGSPKLPLKIFPQMVGSAAADETETRCATSRPPPPQRYRQNSSPDPPDCPSSNSVGKSQRNTNKLIKIYL